MAIKQMIQKGWDIKNIITISSDHIKFQKKSLKEDLEYTVKFEELGFDMFRKINRQGNFAFYIFLAFTLLPVYEVIYGFYTHIPLSEILSWCLGIVFFGGLCFSMFMQRNQETIFLTGGKKTLELIADKPDKQTVLDFIDEIHNASRAYYKDKYLNFDEGTPYEDMVYVLKFLKEIKSITTEEFDVLIAKYKTENIIGFNRNKDI